MKELRFEYGDQPLHRHQLHREPFAQLNQWLNEAIQAGLREPNAVVLSTVSSQGKPSSRTVLIKKMDATGLIFYTNTNSRKAKEMAENPYVSLTFLWKEQERQVRIEGTIQPLSSEDSTLYWRERPRGSQIGAWASRQGQVIASRQVLENRLTELQERFKDQEVPIPSDWGGYRIVPALFEFWQGRRDRLHDRFQYRLDEGSWVIERLSP